MQILVTDPLSSEGLSILRAAGHTVVERQKISADELKKIIGTYDVLLVRSGTTVTAEIISAMDRTKIIGRAGAGVDNINVAAATARNILVMNTPGGNTQSAAEHTIAMLFALARNIPFAHASLTGGTWDRKKWKGIELRGKTIGVVGLGKIGLEVARMAHCLGMEVCALDPVVSAEVIEALGYASCTLEEICKRADVITVHVPLMAATRNLIGAPQFAMCKRGVRIINCARGGIVDEAALVRALDEGIVAGAALDVFTEEPPSNENPLLHHAAVVVTPHIGAATKEAQERVSTEIANQIVAAISGGQVIGGVNLKDIAFAIAAEKKISALTV